MEFLQSTSSPIITDYKGVDFVYYFWGVVTSSDAQGLLLDLLRKITNSGD